MSDNISRADAICEVLVNDGIENIVDRINALPSTDAVDVNDVTIHYKPYPSAEAVTIHDDGTLEVKVPNAHKVGRVLVMDTDSHIGGGLFYPDEAVEGCDGCRYDTRIPQKQCLRCGRYWRDSYERKGGEEE